MDEMKLKLSTRFMRNVASKLIARFVYKKTGYKINIHLDELDVSVIDGETKIIANVELKMDSKEFMKMVKSIEDEEE